MLNLAGTLACLVLCWGTSAWAAESNLKIPTAADVASQPSPQASDTPIWAVDMAKEVSANEEALSKLFASAAWQVRDRSIFTAVSDMLFFASSTKPT
jgi:hypothetical protein